MKKVVIVLLLCILSISFSKMAFTMEQKKKELSLGAKLLYLNPNYKETTVDPFLGTCDANWKGGIGLGLDYTLKEDLKSAITAGFNYVWTKFNLACRLGAQSASAEETVKFIELPITYKFKFADAEGENGFYAGAGVNLIKISIGGESSDSSLGFHLLGGYSFGKNIFSELRYVVNSLSDAEADVNGLSLEVGFKF